MGPTASPLSSSSSHHAVAPLIGHHLTRTPRSPLPLLSHGRPATGPRQPPREPSPIPAHLKAPPLLTGRAMQVDVAAIIRRELSRPIVEHVQRRLKPTPRSPPQCGSQATRGTAALLSSTSTRAAARFFPTARKIHSEPPLSTYKYTAPTPASAPSIHRSRSSVTAAASRWAPPSSPRLFPSPSVTSPYL